MNSSLPRRKVFRAALFILLLSVMELTKANPVDHVTAREIGAKFLNASALLKTDNPAILQLVKTYYTANDDPAFYIFNATNSFVIVSADDCAIPILGYSDEGPLDLENLPLQMEDYMKGFARQIQYAKEEGVLPDQRTLMQWDLVRTTGRINDTRGTSVAPLLSTNWNQSCDYNAHCPEDPNGPCNHVYAGCVATAMGQIMKYWEYPSQGTGSHTYQPDGYPAQTVDFGNTTYQWNNMPDSLIGASASQIDAVATLLWHCGVSVDMMYAADGSGAYSEDVVDALKDYFNYSDELYGEFKEDDATWLIKVKSSLDANRPIYYSGYSWNLFFSAGHAFVCDGYDTDDMLHFNWGWSGSGNGYFAIGALNVYYYAFNFSNYAIFNIHPGNTETTYQINTTLNNPNAGVVSGSGSYAHGTMVHLSAFANNGYHFECWEENGHVVSTDLNYSFKALYNRDLVAVFAEGLPPNTECELVLTALPNYGGTVSGNGFYQYNDQCTVIGNANEGFHFIHWKENGQIISTSNPFTFTIQCDRTITGVFSSDNSIAFEDPNVKAICVSNWDSNGDGELSYAEAEVVTDLGTAFQSNNSITSFNELQYFIGLSTLGDYALGWCNNLTQVTLPNELTTLGMAFYGCRSLSSIIIPQHVTSIDGSVLSGCDALEQIIVVADNPVYDSREQCNAIIKTSTNELICGCSNTVIPGSVTALGNYAFSLNSGLVSIYIPASVSSIGYSTFYACDNLEQIDVDPANTVYDSRNDCNAIVKTQTNKLEWGSKNTIIPNSITSIGKYAFSYRYRDNGYVISLPEQVSDIGNGAFMGGYGISSMIVYPTTPPSLGSRVFDNVPKSILVLVPNGTANAYRGATGWSQFLNIQEMGMEPIAFADPNVKAVCVANWDTNGDGELSYAEAEVVNDLGTAFRSNNSITTFNELQYFIGLSTLGDYAFGWCHNLTQLTLPNELITLGMAFYDCRSLSSIIIPQHVTSIDEAALSGCEALEQIIVLANNPVYDSREQCNAIIKTATNELICGCLNTVIPNSVTALGDYAFSSNSGLASIHIPASVVSIGYNTFYACDNLEQMDVDPANTVYDSRNDCNAIIETNTNTLLWGCKNTVIPNAITAIGNYAFSYRYSHGSFSISIPKAVASVGDGAFLGCSGIQSMTINAAIPPTLGVDVFTNVLHNIPLSVPCHATELYLSTLGWKTFTNYQEDEFCEDVLIIELYPGWNWISNLLTAETPLEVALSDLNPSHGDIIKSQDAYSTYNATIGAWEGSLTYLIPGRGLLYLNKSNQTKSFYYPNED